MSINRGLVKYEETLSNYKTNEETFYLVVGKYLQDTLLS